MPSVHASTSRGIQILPAQDIVRLRLQQPALFDSGSVRFGRHIPLRTTLKRATFSQGEVHMQAPTGKDGPKTGKTCITEIKPSNTLVRREEREK